MLKKTRLAWSVIIALSLTTVAGVAVAVLGGEVLSGTTAKAAASVRLTNLGLEYETDDDRLTLGLKYNYSDHKPASSTGVVTTNIYNYFQLNNQLDLSIGTNYGTTFLDNAAAEKAQTAPGMRGNFFLQSDTNGSSDNIFNFFWFPDTVAKNAADAQFFTFATGFENGAWQSFPVTNVVKASNFTVPSETQYARFVQSFKTPSWKDLIGAYYSTDLSKDVEPVTSGSVPAYNNLLQRNVSLGDLYLGTYRTDMGTAVKIIGYPYSPENSFALINHSFAFNAPAGGEGLTSNQIGILGGLRFAEDLIPQDPFVPTYRVVGVNGVRLVEAEYLSDRQYYYEMLLEAFGFSDDEIDRFLDEIGRWEKGLPNAFDGYEPGLPTEGAAQSELKKGSASDPQANTERLPNDNYFHGKGSWGQDYDDQWGLKQIGVTATGRDGKGAIWPRKAATTKVAVIDTGIDFGHPELNGVLAANFKDIPNNGKDDDGNGYIDDFLGWNFVDNNNDARDMNGHGTFVAGIIAASTDNARGIAGVNPWARIIPVKVTDFDNKGNSVDLAKGIVYAAKLGARVINVSIVGPINKAEQAAVNQAVKLGALVVVAAGNNGKNTEKVAPAGLEGVITVAATNHKGQREAFSNWGPNVDVAAPGSDILSLRAIQTDLMLFADKTYKAGANVVGSDRRYYRLTGTSFSAPYVTGVASLLFSLNPKLTPEQVKRMILQSATDIEIPGTDQFTGYGLLNAPAAIQADPEFYVEARIDTVKVIQKDGQTYVQVLGTADADRFASASMEIGAGREPTQWKKVADDISAKVSGGALQDIAAQNFAGEKTWTLRLVARHENGRTRENRFILNTN